MKLNNLYIANYKNLKEVILDFESGQGLSMLIGNNGSGKSNIIEVISAIFYDAYRTSQFKLICDYKIEYIIRDRLAVINRKNGRRTFNYNGQSVKHETFIREQHLPSNVIGVYSGEEDRLWIDYYEHYYKTYLQKIKTNLPQERMKLMFVNKYYWNIALLTILLSENETLKPFIDNEIHIASVENINLTFNLTKIEQSDNEPLKAFIKRINPDDESMVSIPLNDLKRRIYNNVFFDKDGNLLFDSEGNQLFDQSGIIDSEVFRFFAQSFLPKNDKMITNIEIHFNEDLTTSLLSEGEKKLILIKAILEFVSDENALVLFDEPDAHVHEGRKKGLYNIFHEYSSEYNRQIVLTTHSPTMAQVANSESIIMLEENDGAVSQISADKIEKIRKLTSGAWNVVEHNIIFKSNHPLVVFEGNTDVMYVKKAFALFGKSTEKSRNVNVDFINANGSGNAKSFIDNLLEITDSSKKIIVFFDRDDAGKKGAASVADVSKDSEEIIHYKEIEKDNITIAFIPYREGITAGDFLIEDYFLEPTIQKIIDSEIPENKYPIKNLPNLSKRIKAELEKRYLSFVKEDFAGFMPLVEKIEELVLSKQD